MGTTDRSCIKPHMTMQHCLRVFSLLHRIKLVWSGAVNGVENSRKTKTILELAFIWNSFDYIMLIQTIPLWAGILWSSYFHAIIVLWNGNSFGNFNAQWQFCCWLLLQLKFPRAQRRPSEGSARKVFVSFKFFVQTTSPLLFARVYIMILKQLWWPHTASNSRLRTFKISIAAILINSIQRSDFNQQKHQKPTKNE